MQIRRNSSSISLKCYAARKADDFEASLQETAALDKLIDMMLDCKSQEEVTSLQERLGAIHAAVITAARCFK